MKKSLIFVFVFITALFLAGCGSEPEVVEEPTEEPVEITPEVDLSFLDEAEAALLKAGEVGASEFYPDRFADLSSQLETARTLAETDPEASEAACQEIITAADELYADSLESAKAYYTEQMDKMDGALSELEAEKFAPKTYASTVIMREDVEAKFENDQYSEALYAYRETMAAKQSLKDGLENNISWINILIRDTEMYLETAEEQEAYIWAEEELDMADASLEEGRVHFAAYDIKSAENSLLFAKNLAKGIATAGSRMQQISKTDALLQDVMKSIEEASKITVVDEEGNIITADPWSGEEFLKENPLVELEEETTGEVEEESNLQDYTVPADGTTGVMGEEEEVDGSYLITAKKLWEKGVEARNAENFELANEYFEQAKIFVEAYQSNGVSDFYTVTWREVDTDCLWRISSYDYIYDNPFLWPKIWRRNKKIIQNPDLIFPGQVLIIPPK